MPIGTVEKLPGEPIILIIEPPGSDVLHDMQVGMADTVELVSRQPEPIFLVIDFSGVPMRIDQISKAADMSARRSTDLLHHPNIREVIFVTHATVTKVALKVMGSTAYHEVRMRVVDTLDEALGYCRAQEGAAPR
jgi:hypothetical protein